ncbi:hypothetical protein GGX14DRAFT_664613 [Mycena pura]|uniref:Uncharacterized protein n=1 Tax=Mycena pura TaxID=153505 RepID=A0AAD6V2F6_9AGAR|nr:hypothetical protein GGX14DRAFT_664613 [Mycena pura]
MVTYPEALNNAFVYYAREVLPTIQMPNFHAEVVPSVDAGALAHSTLKICAKNDFHDQLGHVGQGVKDRHITRATDPFYQRPLALARLRHSDLAVAKRRHDCLLLLNARGELDDAGVSRMARRAQRAKATVVLVTILMKCRSCAPPARAPAPPTDKDKGHEISAASLRSRSQLDLS